MPNKLESVSNISPLKAEERRGFRPSPIDHIQSSYDAICDQYIVQ